MKKFIPFHPYSSIPKAAFYFANLLPLHIAHTAPMMLLVMIALSALCVSCQVRQQDSSQLNDQTEKWLCKFNTQEGEMGVSLENNTPKKFHTIPFTEHEEASLPLEKTHQSQAEEIFSVLDHPEILLTVRLARNQENIMLALQEQAKHLDGTGTFFTTQPTGQWILPSECILQNATQKTATQKTPTHSFLTHKNTDFKLSEEAIYQLQVKTFETALALSQKDSFCANDSQDKKHCYLSRIEPLSDEIFDTYYTKMKENTLNPDWNCPAKRKDLSYLWVRHWNIRGQPVIGEIIVASDVAKDIDTAFAKIFTGKYPIERMHPQDYYKGIDSVSMAANNTSGFRCSKDSQKGEHPKGHAIDINPLFNPFIKPNEKKFEPVKGFEDPAPESLEIAQSRYKLDPVEGWELAFQANRLKLKNDPKALPHEVNQLIFSESVPTKAFESIGWFWGGKWNCCADYQHYSINDM